MKYSIVFCTIFLSIVLVFNSFVQQNDFPELMGPYLGQKPPGMTPEIFAPGIVSTSEALEYGIAFAPDGKEFYFNRSGIGVMVCTWNNTGWTAPTKAPFLEKCKGGQVHIMYDGKRLLMNRNPRVHDLREGETGGIWALQKTKDGWDNPVFLIAEGMRATSTLDGSIYTTDISGFRKEGKDQGIIAKYIYSDSGYQRAADPDGGVNTENPEAHPFIAPDESYIIFDSTRPEGKGRSDLYICYKDEKGHWNKAINSELCTDNSDWCATVSPDGKYLFFTRNNTGNGDIYWVDVKIIDQFKPKIDQVKYRWINLD
jgi:hypothetical protein